MWENFINLFLFGSTMLTGAMLFSSREVWKKDFRIRMLWINLGHILLCLLLAWIRTSAAFPEGGDFLIYGVLTFAILLAMLTPFEESRTKLLYNLLATLMIRNAGGRIVSLLLFYFPIENPVLRMLMTTGIVTLSYVFMYFLFARNIARDRDFSPAAGEIVFLLILIILIAPVAFLEPILQKVDTGAFLYLIVMELTIHYGLLGFQYLMHRYAAKNARIARENEQNLRRLQQVESFKGVIDVMNQKCHDLKHQIRRLAGAERVTPEVLGNLEKVAADYEAYIQTGNETLSAILTEKNFLCLSAGITMKCMIDGNAYAFLSQEDMNALFGNLLDNAIEHLRTLPDGEMKLLQITSTEKGYFKKLSVENTCGTIPLTGTDGLPVTSKEDRIHHGFGTRSIVRIAEKYGGNAAFRAEDGLFKAQVIFPQAG